MHQFWDRLRRVSTCALIAICYGFWDSGDGSTRLVPSLSVMHIVGFDNEVVGRVSGFLISVL